MFRFRNSANVLVHGVGHAVWEVIRLDVILQYGTVYFLLKVYSKQCTGN